MMTPFAREVVEAGGGFDLADVTDVQLLQPYSEDDPVPQSVDGEFFARWAAIMGARDDDMVRQLRWSGVEGRAQCTRASVVMGHHGGLREHYSAAADAVESDVRMGFVLKGMDPTTGILCWLEVGVVIVFWLLLLMLLHALVYRILSGTTFVCACFNLRHHAC